MYAYYSCLVRIVCLEHCCIEVSTGVSYDGNVDMFDVCVIGHITRDMVRIENLEKKMPGGVAYYFSMGLKNLGSNVSLVTKVAERDKGLLDDLIKNNVSVFCEASQETTVFENIYPEDLDLRVQNVECVAQPFSAQDIPDISAQIFHLGLLRKKIFL